MCFSLSHIQDYYHDKLFHMTFDPCSTSEAMIFPRSRHYTAGRAALRITNKVNCRVSSHIPRSLL